MRDDAHFESSLNPGRGLFARCALFTGIMLAAYLAAVGIAAPIAGLPGVLAAGVALAICWGSGIGALALMHWLRDPQLALYQMGAAMMVRMLVPLLACMFLYYRGGPVVEAGLVYYLLAFYLVGLVVETTFVMKQLGTHVQRG